MEPRDQAQQVRRVVLPSGRTIDVVCFDGPTSPAGGRPEPGDRDLHSCIACGSQLAYPVDWDEAGDESWRVELRCPECETHRSGVFAQEVVEAFDEHLDLGTDALLGAYRGLCADNMAAEADRLAAALAANAVLPEDFAPRAGA